MQEHKLVLNGGISVYFSLSTKEKLARSACLVQGNFSLVRQPGPCANLALTDSHKVEHLDREMGKGKKKKKRSSEGNASLFRFSALQHKCLCLTSFC